MSNRAPNVLPIFDPPRKMSYRAAIAQVIRDLKSAHRLSNTKLADMLDCSDETISNAEHENSDLNAVTLLRIGYVFGEDIISPVLDLMRRRYVEPKTLADKLNELEGMVASIRKGLTA